MFKLNRMDELLIEDTTFMSREVPVPDLSDKKIFSGGIMVKALFAGEASWSVSQKIL